MDFLAPIKRLFSQKNTLSRYGSLEEAQFWTKISENYPAPGQGGYLGVMAALRAGLVIAQGVGQIDLTVKREKRQGERVIRSDATNDRAFRLLNSRPNDWMTSIELREALTMQAVFTGEGRAIVRRGVDGRPLEILPLHPRWVNAYHDHTRREFVYEVSVEDYGIYGSFTRDDIIEITNPRWDLIRGLNVTSQAAMALGLAQNLEQRQEKLSRKNAPYGIIAAGDAQSEERVQQLKSAWVAQFGEGNGIGVIDFPAEFQQMMGTAQDQQVIENRRFQVEEIARAFGVFPAMLMASDTNSTYASAQEFFSQHIVHTMRPWLKRWKQAIDRTLFDDSRVLSAHFDESGLFRASPIDQMEYWARALGAGGNVPIATRNEARQALGLNPIDGGDELITPTGNTPDSPSVAQGDGEQ